MCSSNASAVLTKTPDGLLLFPLSLPPFPYSTGHPDSLGVSAACSMIYIYYKLTTRTHKSHPVTIQAASF